MRHKLIIPLYMDDVAPRFDLVTEVIIIMVSKDNSVEKKAMVLPRSAEKLCHLIILENINTLICGAIEDEYYQFLTWKKIIIFDAVSGAWPVVFEKWMDKSLNSGNILSERQIEGKNV